MNLAEDCENWGTIFQARQEGPRHLHHEEILRFVQQAPDDINWALDQAEFDDLLALKKDSAPGPDGIPYGVYRCAGGLGSKFLFRAYKAALEGSTIPTCFAESKTVFIPRTSDTDDLGRIIRSPDALRPLTLSNCDCKILTSAICRGLHWYTMRCIHPSQRCISSRQMTDNIFENETTALAHVACSTRIRCSFDRLCCCLSQCQSLLDLLCAREHWVACLSLSLPAKYLQGQHHARGICRSRTRTVPDGQRSTTSVNRISPDTAIHEQMAAQNYFTTSTTS